MKRKIITLFLVGAMVFSLAACGSENTSQENNSEDAQTTQEEQDTDNAMDTEEASESADTEAAQSTDSNILIAYFSIPEDIDTSGIDADAGASVVVRDGETVGNMQFMAESKSATTSSTGGLP